MNITVEDVAPCKKRLKIEVPANRVKQAYDRVTDDFQREARIPGFRPGHAPRTVVVKKYHKAIEDETQRTLVPEAYQEAIAEKKLRVVSQPAIEDLHYQAGLSLSFSTVVELVPDFKLPNYKGIVIKKHDTIVTDEDVEKTLASLAEQRSTFDDAPDRALAMDDFAIISYTGRVDGVPISEIEPQAKNLAENPNFWLWMKPQAFLPMFAEQCVGMKKGETRSVDVEFPADFPQAALAGKKAQYDVELKEIKIKKSPPVDDAFAQDLAKMDLTELKKRVKENMEQEKKNRAIGDQRTEIIQKLIGSVEFELPPTALDEETHATVYDIVSENQSRGVSADLLEEKKDEIFTNAAKAAKESVKFKFIAAQIAEAEKLEVTNEQIAQHLAFLAQREGITMEKMVDRVRKNNAFGIIRQQLLRQQVLDFLLKEAKSE
ncbi:MAG TPA: trigger factor [Candidatus Methylacidiphilales bacterium]|jgi:trigger factor|nr:trigger factor [Candidatus Methylacidiphilales bacterium]